MANALHHRGPDEAGVYRDRTCGLAHTRLSIIDVASGQQPMCDVDGDAYVVFNGEIFNHVELRAELVALGCRFRTRSDTEVVIQALRTWGEDALDRFNGQFAIALWRPATQTLLLARDRFGVRPLHICEHAGRVYFASEVKAIFSADPSIPRQLDPSGLVETFTFWSVLAPTTMFRGVEELRPGHVRVYSPERVREHAFTDLRFGGEPFQGSLADAAAALRDALERATQLRLSRSDVPVGCYLSGGLDSSAITALARQSHGEQLRTFSLRFTDADLDEGAFQREMVERLQTQHIELGVSRADIANALPAAIRHIERPILRTAPVPMMLLARRVHEAGIKVVLTGEGADEMLAGYDLFREARVRRFWAREPTSQSRPRLLERLYPYLTRSPSAARAMARQFYARDLDRPHAPEFAHGPRWAAASALQRLLNPEIREAAAAAAGDPVQRLVNSLPAAFASWDPLERDQYIEARTLLSGYLLAAQGDRVAMATSVEGRFPFLDREVVALACSLPPDYKLRVLDEKHVLKRAVRDIMPASIVRRPKQPFRAPDAVAFCSDPIPGWAHEELDERVLAESGIFDPHAVAQLWRKCRERTAGPFSNADNMALTGVLSTQLLMRQLIRGRPETSDTIPIRTLIQGDHR